MKSYRDRDKENEFIDGVKIGIFILLFVGLLFFLDRGIDTWRWNDGYCSCGGKWQYQQAVGHSYTTGHIYRCTKCGKKIELDYDMTR